MPLSGWSIQDDAESYVEDVRAPHWCIGRRPVTEKSWDMRASCHHNYPNKLDKASQYLSTERAAPAVVAPRRATYRPGDHVTCIMHHEPQLVPLVTASARGEPFGHMVLAQQKLAQRTQDEPPQPCWWYTGEEWSSIAIIVTYHLL